MNHFKNKMRDEKGVAMVTVIVTTAVLMMLGGGMYLVASGEQSITRADYAGSQAFYYAEGGIENVIDILNYAATETQLTAPRTDQSADQVGYLMDPQVAERSNPTDPIEMNIAGEKYKVWVEEVDAAGNPCPGCSLDFTQGAASALAHLLITAEVKTNDGYRKLQQRVKLEASGFPLTLFIDGSVTANGNMGLTNQTIYVHGDYYGRGKLEVTGANLPYDDPATVYATGRIHKKTNGNSPIYGEDGLPVTVNWDSTYSNDRDEKGIPNDTFTEGELQSRFSTSGLTSAQLALLKGMAKNDGYYANPTSGDLMIRDTDITPHDGNIVVFVEYSGGTPVNNEVNLKFAWPYGKVFVVVLNGSVFLSGQDAGNLEGMIYSPDGPITAHGAGTNNFTGILWGKGAGNNNVGLNVSGTNFDFSMTSAFLNDAPFFAWTVVRETGWKEADR